MTNGYKAITLRMSPQQKKELQWLVLNGYYVDLTDAIRNAIHDLVEFHRFHTRQGCA